MDQTVSILKEYGELLTRVDYWFKRCLSSAGDVISCRTGCSFCCRGLFDITLLDAFYLKMGFDLLPNDLRSGILSKAEDRLESLKEKRPEWLPPYIINNWHDDDWVELMPEEDETPCPLLADDGTCTVYDWRPMTCRLHGIPLIDVSGEVMDDKWCTENFRYSDPMLRLDIRGEFIKLFTDELKLFRRFTKLLMGEPLNEMDTVIPAALVMDNGSTFTSLRKPSAADQLSVQQGLP